MPIETLNSMATPPEFTTASAYRVLALAGNLHMDQLGTVCRLCTRASEISISTSPILERAGAVYGVDRYLMMEEFDSNVLSTAMDSLLQNSLAPTGGKNDDR